MNGLGMSLSKFSKVKYLIAWLYKIDYPEDKV